MKIQDLTKLVRRLVRLSERQASVAEVAFVMVADVKGKRGDDRREAIDDAFVYGLQAVRELKKEAEELERAWMTAAHELLHDTERERVTTGVASVRLQTRKVVQVDDWSAFLDHVLDGHVELLERRPAKGACWEVFEQNETIPGVRPETVETVFVSKVKGTK